MSDYRPMYMHLPWTKGNSRDDVADRRRAYALHPERGHLSFVYEFETEQACVAAIGEHNQVLINASSVVGSKEVVLPSGRYARMRTLNWMDMLNSYDPNPFKCLALLAMAAVTIDDKPVDIDFISKEPLAESMPIMSMLGDALSQANKHSGGVK